MEVDTWASISLLNFSTYNDLKAEEHELSLTFCRLRMYTADIVKPTNEFKMKFQYEEKLMLHDFIITDDISPVLGRDVLKWVGSFFKLVKFI